MKFIITALEEVRSECTRAQRSSETTDVEDGGLEGETDDQDSRERQLEGLSNYLFHWTGNMAMVFKAGAPSQAADKEPVMLFLSFIYPISSLEAHLQRKTSSLSILVPGRNPTATPVSNPAHP